MLHREYVPFMPIRCKKPEGPLDPPLFPPDKYDVPPGFWEDSARECFKAAREIMDLVRTCQEWSALVETPIVGFAIYTVAFVGVYCINFPHMDPGGYMCTPRPPDTSQNSENAKSSKGFEAARKALEMIGQMRPKLRMADGWFTTINRVHKYFRRMKSDYKKNTAALESNTSESDGSPISSRHLSLREGGSGGGLDEFKLLERTLKEFGNLEDQDVEMTNSVQRPNSRALDNVYDDSNSHTTVKSEEAENRAGATEPPRSDSGPWNAINSASGGASRNGSRNGSMSAPGSAQQFRPYDSHQQPHQQSQAPPPQQHSYAHQINNFRPAYETPSAPGAPPSLTSPASHSASTGSRPSPPFDRQHQHSSAWTAQNRSYQMQPPHPAVYTNGISHLSHQPTPMQGPGAYPTQAQQPPQHMQAPAPMQEQHQPWNQMEKEAWLNNLDTRLGGDDFAAFVDGGDLADWATMARGYGGGGWLSAVWDSGGGTGG